MTSPDLVGGNKPNMEWSNAEKAAALELAEAAVRCIGAFGVPKATSLHEVELLLTPAVGAFLFARSQRENS